MTDYNKLSLFENISKEEVVLFAGAGLSLYAGFPSGNVLRDIFFNSLNEAEKAQIIPNFQEIDENYVTQSLNLMDLTEAIYDLKGNRNHLIKVLRDVFNKKPTSLQVHENIAKIPHLKNIITTNYDTLFEDALGDTGEVILENNHIPYMDPKKRQVFKIHGDLNHIDRIILKKTDYNDFFKNNSENDIYWNLIKERLSTNVVMFIGYSLDDSNISVIFDKIIDSIGDDMKDVYFIAPNLSEPKKTKLIKKNIKYIESKGEEIFKEILEYLNNNIIKDLEKGKVAPNTVKSYTDKNFGLGISLVSNNSNTVGFYLANTFSINGGEDNLPRTFTFSIKKDSMINGIMKDALENGLNKDLIINNDDLASFQAWIGNLKIKDLSDIESLRIVATPDFEGYIDVVFEDDEFELNHFNVKLFKRIPSENVLEMHIDNTDFIIDIKIITDHSEGVKVNFNMTLKECISSVRSYLNFMTTLNKIWEGKKFFIISQGKKLFEYRSAQILDANGFAFYTSYFQLLKEIEKYYRFKFLNIVKNEITNDNYYKLRMIKAKINGSVIEIPFKDLTIINSNNKENGNYTIDDDKESNKSLVILENYKEVINIHQHEIVLGYREIHIANPEYSKDPYTLMENNELIINNDTGVFQCFYRDHYITPS